MCSSACLRVQPYLFCGVCVVVVVSYVLAHVSFGWLFGELVLQLCLFSLSRSFLSLRWSCIAAPLLWPCFVSIRPDCRPFLGYRFAAPKLRANRRTLTVSGRRFRPRFWAGFRPPFWNRLLVAPWGHASGQQQFASSTLVPLLNHWENVKAP